MLEYPLKLQRLRVDPGDVRPFSQRLARFDDGVPVLVGVSRGENGRPIQRHPNVVGAESQLDYVLPDGRLATRQAGELLLGPASDVQPPPVFRISSPFDAAPSLPSTRLQPVAAWYRHTSPARLFDAARPPSGSATTALKVCVDSPAAPRPRQRRRRRPRIDFEDFNRLPGAVMDDVQGVGATLPGFEIEAVRSERIRLRENRVDRDRLGKSRRRAVRFASRLGREPSMSSC